MKKIAIIACVLLVLSVPPCVLLVHRFYVNSDKIDKLMTMSYLDRKTKNDILALLGEPDRTDQESNKYYFRVKTYEPGEQVTKNEDGTYSETVSEDEVRSSKEVLIYIINFKKIAVVIGTFDEVLKVSME